MLGEEEKGFDSNSRNIDGRSKNGVIQDGFLKNKPLASILFAVSTELISVMIIRSLKLIGKLENPASHFQIG